MKKTTKKIAALALSGAMLLSGLAATSGAQYFLEVPAIVASAYTTLPPVTSGYATYTFFQNSDGKATITRIDLSSSCPSNYSLTVPSTLSGLSTQALHDDAFQNNASKIGNLTLPDSVKRIGFNTFKNCTSLNSLTLSENLDSVDECCFYNVFAKGKLNYLYLRKSNGNIVTVTRQYIENVAAHTTFEKVSGSNRFKVNSGNDAIVSLIAATSGTEFAARMYRSKATQIYTDKLKPYLTDRQKMQMLYNYLVTSTRYCNIAAKDGGYDYNGNYYTSVNTLSRMDQSAMGALFFHIGVCAGYSDALWYLGDAAGLDIKTVSKSGHKWNLFRPSGESKYYIVDSVNGDCGVPYSKASFDYMKTATQTATDGTNCTVANTFMGDTILVRFKNDFRNSNLNVRLVKHNASGIRYCNYNTYFKNDQGTLSCTELPIYNDKYIYADANTYYDLEIRDTDGNLLKNIPYALNNLPVAYHFYDADGIFHCVQIAIKNDVQAANDNTSNNAFFSIWLDNYAS